MQLTITSADADAVLQIDVDPQQRVASIALRLQEQFSIPATQQILLLNGSPIRLNVTFQDAGVKPDDLLVLLRNPSETAAPRPASMPPVASGRAQSGMQITDIPPNATPELLLEIMEKNPQLMPGLESGNPKLAEALKTKSVSEVRMVLLQMHMEAASRQFQEQEELSALEANPFDTAAQAKIEERIRLSNVQKNMEIAIEEMPEAFARVYMLYIPCEVNGIPVKAFVDSGAQSTIMSSSCAERCGIMRLVDKRFAGQAVGVGTAKIIGRVHMAPLKIGNYFYNCSFTILDQQNVDFLFGLDMLKRHQCCIDLHKNVLRLHDATGGHEVEFLPEHEIPMSERSDPAIPASPVPSAASPAPAPAPAPVASPSPSAPGAADDSREQKIEQLVALGFERQRAITALDTTNGNVDLAAGLLFESMG
ncbi:hypothetical protein Poli38472_006330 [Pythium oligandrum]|uniref:DNA damage-inducible protein 1 n=1 Tax=Pythium oligandrum TaxID=41045 RepID=A0A8K1C4K2_PYTOL|nr:hypothetical protein Poli38472_006330 [Pythium oligandrum]|eukprot:TMW56320.1 hypothetical protein Poli38472_006330 [Pythium oligandrum]